MDIYLVGGGVRDQLLGIEVQDRDWVVVGATPEQMLALGYKPVGKDFPVFLHPQTHEEYALARTERKSGKGHKGFTFYTHTDVTLEQDLARRDLTINAMAQDATGTIIDPYQGQQDLQQRILRHVSASFSEDPLRVYRLARFSAQLAQFNFTIAEPTLDLACSMVAAGACNELSNERIWQETVKALTSSYPSYYFASLKQCQALSWHFPHISNHTIAALARAQKTHTDPKVRWAIVTCQGQVRLKMPSDYQQLNNLIVKHHHNLANWLALDAQHKFNLIERCDGLRKPKRFIRLITSAAAIHQQKIPIDQIQETLYKMLKLDCRDLQDHYQGPQLGAQIRNRRIQLLTKQ